MRLINLTMLLCVTLLFAFSSCNNEDDSSSTITAEDLVGEWAAAEVVDGQSANFTVTISLVDGNLSLRDSRFPPPVYSVSGFLFPYDEEEQTFELGTVSGVVENSNSITMDYAFGTSTTIFNVDLELTR